uniref:Uncharacterized protein n=1 Tax=Rhizophora mucronata TaxID=61149 RepID=A0A2P2N0J8_RHIMU
MVAFGPWNMLGEGKHIWCIKATIFPSIFYISLFQRISTEALQNQSHAKYMGLIIAIFCWTT